jgi:hypothetical protein
MKKYKVKDSMPISVAIFFIVTGLIMGSVFIFGMQYWGESIEKEDAIAVSADFESYSINYGRHGSVSELKIIFSDHAPLCIDGVCISDEVSEGIRGLSKGAKLDMLVHPNSDTIWELKHGIKTILSFEESQKDIKGENIGFGVIGIFMYFCAAIGLGSLLMRWIRARKKKRR